MIPTVAGKEFSRNKIFQYRVLVNIHDNSQYRVNTDGLQFLCWNNIYSPINQHIGRGNETIVQLYSQRYRRGRNEQYRFHIHRFYRANFIVSSIYPEVVSVYNSASVSDSFAGSHSSAQDREGQARCLLSKDVYSRKVNEEATVSLVRRAQTRQATVHRRVEEGQAKEERIRSTLSSSDPFPFTFFFILHSQVFLLLHRFPLSLSSLRLESRFFALLSPPSHLSLYFPFSSR